MLAAGLLSLAVPGDAHANGAATVGDAHAKGAATVGDAQAEGAATVGDETVALREVDARCGAKCARLEAEIDARERETLAALVADALLERAPRPTPSAVPVADAEVEAYVAAHAADFTGTPERDRRAVRFLLERERRRALEERLAAQERERGDVVVHEERLTPDGTSDDVLARVGATEIRRRDVEERAALPLYRLHGELARERVRRLDELVEERLWQAAARERGTTAEALRAEAAREAPAVTDEDVDRYFAGEIASRDPSAVKRPERIRPYLEFRARRTAQERFLARERASRPVVVHLAEPEPPRVRLGPSAGGVRGARDAAVRLVFLTSYRGEASRRAWALARTLAEAPDVALAVRPLLPQWDPDALDVAAAVRCADAQGRFWAMQDTVAAAPELPDRAALLAAARRLGLDAASLERCMERPDVAQAIAADSAAAERLGLDRPPVLLVEGLVLAGLQSHERVRRAIEAARDGARPTPAPALSAPSAPSPALSAPSAPSPALSAPSAPSPAFSAPSRRASASP